MHATEQRLMQESRGSPTARSGLLWAGVAIGACILAIHSFSGKAIDDATLAPALMTGANLSILHAAIPAGSEESTASF